MDHWLALEGATLLDGTGAPARPDCTVLIRGDRICSVGPRGAVVLPEGAERHDVTGRWILPGLLDVHVHAETRDDLRALLAWGVTAFRNPAATRTTAAPPPRSPGSSGSPGLPPLRGVYAGPPIDHPPSPWPGAEEVTTAEEVRAAVGRQAAAGVDLIKLYVRLPPELVRAAVLEAHRCGLPVLGDLALTTWTDAARAGIDFLSHAMPRHPSLLPARHRAEYVRALAERRVEPLGRWFELVDLDGPEIREMIGALRDHGVRVDPTLVGVETALGVEDALGGPDSRATECAWSKVLGLVSRLREAGVELLAGTDAPRPGIPAGESLHRELGHLVDAGFSNAEVLGIATGKNATALGLDQDHGLLAPGRRADLLILGADPVARLASLRSLERVYLGGVVCPGVAYPGRLVPGPQSSQP